MVGIISYEDYTIQISSESLKRVVRGEKLHKVKGLADVFSGIIIQGRAVIPVLSRESFNSFIETRSDLNEMFRVGSAKNSCSDKQPMRSMFALLTCEGYDFALPLDEVLSIFDDCQQGKSDSDGSRFIALECRDLLDYILLQKGGLDEV